MAGDVFLPTVAISHSDWTQQIYQFVVINEKAQKVDSELLNDIFASSLTPTEQAAMREGFVRVKVDIEERIAGVIAGRDKESPFYQMVTLILPNPACERGQCLHFAEDNSVINRGWQGFTRLCVNHVRR